MTTVVVVQAGCRHRARISIRLLLWSCPLTSCDVIKWAHCSAAWSCGRNAAVTTDSQACEMDVATLEILVLRAWLEPEVSRGSASAWCQSTQAASRQMLTTSSVEDAGHAVRNWLTNEPEAGPPAL